MDGRKKRIWSKIREGIYISTLEEGYYYLAPFANVRLSEKVPEENDNDAPGSIVVHIFLKFICIFKFVSVLQCP